MNTLSASGLADLAGVTEAEVERLVDFGILVTRDGDGPFLETDAQKVRLATSRDRRPLACHRGNPTGSPPRSLASQAIPLKPLY